MKRIFILLGISLVSMMPATYAATDKNEEIQYLLNYIEASQCTFVRNGTSHDSTNARAHIEMKYDYVKSRVDSTEDFIRYTATKSSMSGIQYEVICAGERYATGKWLQQELQRFRQQGQRM